MRAPMWLVLLVGCNAAFGIDDLEPSGATSVAVSAVTVGSMSATNTSVSSGSTMGAGGMGGSGGSSDGGSVPQGPKRVFVTSQEFNGNFGGYDGAQQLCIDAAANLGSTQWHAWLSDHDHNAIDELVDVGPWVLVDGMTQVAANKAQLGSGMLDHPIDMTENMTIEMKAQPVWTGTAPDGNVVSTGVNHHCNSWTAETSANGGWVGSSSDADGSWTQVVQFGCQSTLRLYCFEQ